MYSINMELEKVFTDNVEVTLESFPSMNELRDIFFRNDVHQALQMIKSRILQSKRDQLDFIRIIPGDILTVEITQYVKQFLRNQGYTIIELETNEGVSIGWKMNFL